MGKGNGHDPLTTTAAERIGKKRPRPTAKSLENLKKGTFVKGKSGNPGGRPKEVLRAALREFLQHKSIFSDDVMLKLQEKFPHLNQNSTCTELLTHAVWYGSILSAMAGNTTPAMALIEQVDGKMKQPIELPEGFVGALVVIPGGRGA